MCKASRMRCGMRWFFLQRLAGLVDPTSYLEATSRSVRQAITPHRATMLGFCTTLACTGLVRGFGAPGWRKMAHIRTTEPSIDP